MMHADPSESNHDPAAATEPDQTDEPAAATEPDQTDEPDQIVELEADIDLVDAAMAHLDSGDLEAADAAVRQLDDGADPTLFAAAALEGIAGDDSTTEPVGSAVASTDG